MKKVRPYAPTCWWCCALSLVQQHPVVPPGCAAAIPTRSQEPECLVGAWLGIPVQQAVRVFLQAVTEALHFVVEPTQVHVQRVGGVLDLQPKQQDAGRV
jgi:hypothetical protein